MQTKTHKATREIKQEKSGPIRRVWFCIGRKGFGLAERRRPREARRWGVLECWQPIWIDPGERGGEWKREKAEGIRQRAEPAAPVRTHPPRRAGQGNAEQNNSRTNSVSEHVLTVFTTCFGPVELVLERRRKSDLSPVSFPLYPHPENSINFSRFVSRDLSTWSSLTCSIFNLPPSDKFN